MLAELIEEFCEGADGCTYYKGYSGRFMYGRRCPGIVVEKGYSYLEVLMSLTRWLEDHDFEEYDELLNPACDSLGLDTICYFPNAKED